MPTVDSEVAVSDGQKLVLKYKDGEKTFIVPPDTAIVAFAPGDRGRLKPGDESLRRRRTKQPDGTLNAPSITVGRDGVNPPMY